MKFPTDANLQEEARASYGRDGYILVRGLFDSDEIALLRQNAEQDSEAEAVLTKEDEAGNPVRLRMWAEAGDDLFGMFSRSSRIVAWAEFLIGAPVYLYSSKMILKDAREGGAWEWHQDYGYWYNNGCLAPAMMSCMIAVDANSRDNGCLQVLRGSHQLGRLDHSRVGEQFVADSERVAVALDRFDHAHIELEPGDTLLFDCNLLHRSDANTSDRRRWNFICSYNAEANRPYKQMRDYGHGAPLAAVSDDAIRAFASGVAE